MIVNKDEGLPLCLFLASVWLLVIWLNFPLFSFFFGYHFLFLVLSCFCFVFSSQAETFPKLAVAAQWFQERFDRIKETVPPVLRPKYFAIVISEAYKASRRAAIEQFSEFVSTGSAFTHDLALTSVQMYGMIQSASLDPAKPTPSLAAGLPHFTTNWARCWGRDVFISLRGLFLTTGNFEGAKKHILAFASTLKHGLIPNLLDSVRNPRCVTSFLFFVLVFVLSSLGAFGCFFDT